MARLALTARAALATVRDETAGSGHAIVPGHTLAVVGASIEAGGTVADEGITGQRRRRHTLAGLVTRGGRCVGAQDTAFGAANSTGRVHLAGAGTVAQAIRSTRRFALVFAAVARIECSRGNAQALAGRAGQVAASAGAAACAFATDAVDALPGFAIARVRAGHAGLSLSARAGRRAILRSGDALVARLAVGVD